MQSEARHTVREPAVAGLFYPGNRSELERMVAGFLASIRDQGPLPKAIIAPHAGYIYSGPIAASAYGRLRQSKSTIERVVLLGPSHRVPFAGLAITTLDAFRTPLGEIPVDKALRSAVLDLPDVLALDSAHAEEHSLEVHLPFLQEILEDFTVLPVVVGEARPESVARLLDRVWDGDETLIVVSSDLSHYHPYATAQSLDRATSAAIESFDIDHIGSQQACGCYPVNGLLATARRRKLQVETVDLRNSGDTAGPRDRVVGYGAYVLTAAH